MTKRLVLNGDYEIQTFRIRDLSEAEVGKIVKRIKDIHLSFSPSSNEEKIRSRLCKNSDSCIDVVTQTKTGECGGYSAYYTEEFGARRVMFLDVIIIGSEHRSRGLAKVLLENIIARARLDFFVAMTQNPRVYETMLSFSSKGLIYPAKDVQLPEEIKEIASQFCKELGFDRNTLIVRDTYQRISKDAGFKKVRSSAVETFFTENLGKDDGFMVVVPLR